MERQPDYTIDVNGEYSPFTLLKISQVFRKMTPGDMLEIRECDPETCSDVFRILPSEACRLISDGGVDSAAGAARSCRIRVLKTEMAQQSQHIHTSTPTQKGPI